MGYRMCVGPEAEFFLFHIDEDGKPTTNTHDNAGYFDLGTRGLGRECPSGDVYNPGADGF
jgi:glutamine synthetase